MANGNFDLDATVEQAKLIGFFQQRTMISGYNRSIVAANLYDPSQSTRPSWYGDLEANMVATQAAAQDWFDHVAPPMTSLPQTYIDFDTTFAGLSGVLTAQLDALIAGTGGDAAIDTLMEVFGALLNDARGRQAALAASNLHLAAHLQTMTDAIRGLTQGAGTVNDALQSEKQAVADATAALAGLHAQLAADIKAAAAADTGTLIGLIGAIVAIVLAVAAPGAGTIAGAVVAGLFVAGGVVGTAVTANAIVNDQIAIIAKQAELSDDAQQVVVLNGLSLTVNALVDTYSGAPFDTAPLLATWTTLTDNLHDVRDLIVASRADPHLLGEIRASLADFGTTIATVAAFCERLQDAALSADTVPIHVVTIPTSLAA